MSRFPFEHLGVQSRTILNPDKTRTIDIRDIGSQICFIAVNFTFNHVLLLSNEITVFIVLTIFIKITVLIETAIFIEITVLIKTTVSITIRSIQFFQQL